MEVICANEECRKPFEARRSDARYCSSACRGKAHRAQQEAADWVDDLSDLEEIPAEMDSLPVFPGWSGITGEALPPFSTALPATQPMLLSAAISQPASALPPESQLPSSPWDSLRSTMYSPPPGSAPSTKPGASAAPATARSAAGHAQLEALLHRVDYLERRIESAERQDRSEAVQKEVRDCWQKLQDSNRELAVLQERVNGLPIRDDAAVRRLIRDEVSPLLRPLQDRPAHSEDSPEVVRLGGRLDRLESSWSTALALKADAAVQAKLKAKEAELREVVMTLIGRVNQVREDLLRVATQVGSFAETILPKRTR